MFINKILVSLLTETIIKNMETQEILSLPDNNETENHEDFLIHLNSCIDLWVDFDITNVVTNEVYYNSSGWEADQETIININKIEATESINGDNIEFEVTEELEKEVEVFLKQLI